MSLESAKNKNSSKSVPAFSYYIKDVIPQCDRIAGEGYDALSDLSKKCIDNAIKRYIEWLSKIHHGIIENPQP